MAQQVQLRRGSTAEHSTFTGAVGEITVDTTKDTVVVHDGALAGGYPLAKESALSGFVTTSDIGSTVQAYDVDTAKTDVTQTFTAGQRGEVTALTSASSITIDMADSNNFSLLLAHNVTLANPTNLTAGQSGAIVITQSSGGSNTVSYGSYFKFPGGTVPTKTTTANSVCVLLYYVESATRITAQLLNDVKV